MRVLQLIDSLNAGVAEKLAGLTKHYPKVSIIYLYYKTKGLLKAQIKDLSIIFLERKSFWMSDFKL